jgi:hypothetical protein
MTDDGSPVKAGSWNHHIHFSRPLQPDPLLRKARPLPIFSAGNRIERIEIASAQPGQTGTETHPVVCKDGDCFACVWNAGSQ